jgi:hypothetical protein
MRNLQDLLKEKEAELARVTQEVEALRVVARLLVEDSGDKGRSAPARDTSRDQVPVPPRVKVFP